MAALIVSGASNGELRRNSLRALPIVLVPLIVPGVLIARAAPSKIALMPLVPAVAAMIVAAVVAAFGSPLNRLLLLPATGEPQSRPGTGWVVLVVTLLPVLFVFAWLVVGSRSSLLEISALQGGPMASAWVVLVMFAHNLLLGGSLGEEIGWRGFLLPALLRRMSPLAASVVVGVVWELWHLPIDLVTGFGVQSIGAVVARVVYAVPVSIVFTWFHLRTKGGLLVALLLHSSINVMGDVGLSIFDAASVVYLFMVAMAAFVVLVSSPVFRRTMAHRAFPAADPSRLESARLERSASFASIHCGLM